MEFVVFGARSPLVVDYEGTVARNSISPVSVVHAGGGAPQVLKRRAATRSSPVGDGNFLNDGLIVGAASRLGAHLLVNRASSIGHHCNIEDQVSIGPSLYMASCARVGFGAIVGTIAIFLPDTSIGPQAIVSAGSVVRADVAAGKLVAVAPAHRRDCNPAAGFFGETDVE